MVDVAVVVVAAVAVGDATADVVPKVVVVAETLAAVLVVVDTPGTGSAFLKVQLTPFFLFANVNFPVFLIISANKLSPQLFLLIFYEFLKYDKMAFLCPVTEHKRRMGRVKPVTSRWEPKLFLH